MRFPNDYAADDIDIVLVTVKNALDTSTPSPYRTSLPLSAPLRGRGKLQFLGVEVEIILRYRCELHGGGGEVAQNGGGEVVRESPSPPSGERVGVRGMISDRIAKGRRSLAENRVRARKMRHKPVTMEKLFWSEVRNRKLGGYKFKRQFPIGHYIVDFVCAEHKLIVELDGPFHASRAEYDAARDAFLEAQGFRVLRFPNDYAADDIAIVLVTVKNALDTSAPSP